jgi:hypothetical protein
MLEGGCFCGKIRYEVHGVPFNASICHCVDCRRVAAAPIVAWFSVKRSEFRYVRGEPRQFASSEKVRRAFCPDCGTPLTYWQGEAPDDIDISTASLDHPASVPPQDHVWMAQSLPWIRMSDDLPHYPSGRAEP